MRKIVLVGLLGTAALLAGCAQKTTVYSNQNTNQDTATGTQEVVPQMVTVEEQKAGNTVTIGSLALADDGFVVVRESINGQPTKIVGVSGYLKAGDHTNIVVKLNKTYPVGTRLAAFVHKDNKDKKFNAVNDVPALDEHAQPVTMEFLFTE